jgi:hypothetical protein
MILPLVIGNIFMIVSVALNFSYLPPQIPLFYSKSWGEDQLGEIWMIALLPIILNSLYLLNLFVYKKYFPQNEFVRRIVFYFNIFLVIAACFILSRIVFLIS